MTVLEVVRALVLLNGVLLVLQSLRVVSVYSAVYTLTKDERRQLPLHVWLMALSFAMYVGGTTYFLFRAENDNLLGRLLLYGVAGAIAQYGLWNVLQYDRRRYSRVTHFQDTEAEEVRATFRPGLTKGAGDGTAR
jgi:hypothetical protein